MAKERALLKVVTLHRESYDHLAVELRAELGAVLQVTDVLDHPNDNLMLVSPKGFGVDLAGAVTVPVVTLERTSSRGATVIHGFSRERFDDFKLEPPERVEPLQLSAALYGIGSQLQMRTLLPESCLLDNERRTLQNILKSDSRLTPLGRFNIIGTLQTDKGFRSHRELLFLGGVLMSAKQVMLTADGLKRLEDELEELKP